MDYCGNMVNYLVIVGLIVVILSTVGCVTFKGTARSCLVCAEVTVEGEATPPDAPRLLPQPKDWGSHAAGELF